MYKVFMSMLILFVSLVMVYISAEIYYAIYPKHYLVRCTFCDGRKPIELVVKGDSDKCSITQISNYKLAVPEWNGYKNVCQVDIIKELD